MNTWAKRIDWIVRTFYPEGYRDAGRKLGVSGETIRMQAAGKTEPSFETLAAVAEKHEKHVRLEWLVFGTGPREPLAEDPDPRVSTAEGIRDRILTLVRDVEAEYGLRATSAIEASGGAELREKAGKMKPTDTDGRRGHGTGDG